ncbi:glutathione S-transferase L3-like isoform X2 [Rhododendron vialii]|uniref:glutathione S-transferase L3-like isoform X2 n=1 Tax=Rhododendron vialii TaxID=182163 RepID=UPI00266006AF|nr:glutathione S-transferase L3-like isoform X2 [Rhododendron vialii]
MPPPFVKEDLPPILDSTSLEPPPLFDGTTRLYIAYTCPYAQRAWIARNYKGLQDEIKLVAIDIGNKPIWYKEKVYPENKDPSKQQFAEELLEYTNTFNKTLFTSFKGDPAKEIGSAFDYLETALNKFKDDPFFLGQFSLVDIAYGPFIGNFQIIFQDVWKYDITAGRPKLGAWIEEMNKIDAYTQTKYDPAKIVASYKKRFLGQ